MNMKSSTKASDERDPRIVIVGAGMSGMLMGILLKRKGFGNFQILEKAAQIGGTWRDNHYPGVACDVPAYTYTYSFEPNCEWSRRFAEGAEIKEYFEGVYRKYELDNYIRCNAKAEAARYENNQWLITLAGGETLQADIVVTAAGVLHHPNMPDIPGLETFAGNAWHSSQWDHSVDLSDKRVGIIGTGSTAAQIVGALAGKTRKLVQFQRTPQWVHPAFDAPYSEWSKKLLRRMPFLTRTLRRVFEFSLFMTLSRLPVPGSYFQKMLDWGSRRALKQVKDPELRRKLTPDYVVGCKRIILSDQYYQAIQHPDSHLVCEGIEKIELGGIRTKDGQLHEIDVLVMATGFQAHNYMRPMEVKGQDGLHLDDFWEPGAVAHRGVAVPGFPNFFMMLGPHSPIGNFSVIAISEAQANYVMKFIEMFRQGKAARVQPNLDATQSYNDAMRKVAKGTIWARGGCKSWYLDKSGLPAIWPGTFAEYKQSLEAVNLDEFDLSPPEGGTVN